MSATKVVRPDVPVKPPVVQPFRRRLSKRWKKVKMHGNEFNYELRIL